MTSVRAAQARQETLTNQQVKPTDPNDSLICRNRVAISSMSYPPRLLLCQLPHADQRGELWSHVLRVELKRLFASLAG
jgi:hypothetical protein